MEFGWHRPRRVSLFEDGADQSVDPYRIRPSSLLALGVYLSVVLVAAWAAPQLMANRITLVVLGHDLAFGGGHGHHYGLRLLLVLVVPTIFLIELTMVGWRDSSLWRLVRRTPSSMTDAVCFLVGQTPVMDVVSFVATLGLVLVSAQWLQAALRQWTGYNPSLAGAPFAGQLLIYFLVFSFIDYWTHRLDHSRWFWPLHRYHHAADDFCIFSAVRVHPAAFTGVIPELLPAVLVGASPEVLTAVSIFVVTHRYVIHSRMNANFGWVGRYMLQSPTHHRLHHSAEKERIGGHYSLVPLWDHLFGTWRGEADQSLPIGVDTAYRQGMWLIPDWWRDYCEFWSGLSLLGRKQ